MRAKSEAAGDRDEEEDGTAGKKNTDLHNRPVVTEHWNWILCLKEGFKGRIMQNA